MTGEEIYSVSGLRYTYKVYRLTDSKFKVVKISKTGKVVGKAKFYGSEFSAKRDADRKAGNEGKLV